jgi:hypothetical protein
MHHLEHGQLNRTLDHEIWFLLTSILIGGCETSTLTAEQYTIVRAILSHESEHGGACRKLSSSVATRGEFRMNMVVHAVI